VYNVTFKSVLKIF